MNKLIKMFDKISSKIYCLSLKKKISTSLSDDQRYPQVCIDAVNKFKYFNKFRRNQIYTSIVETVSKEIGYKYHSFLINDDFIMSQINGFKKNDEWGGPNLYYYEKTGEISPTSLRYLKVTKDLHDFFKNLNDFNIVEIGVGYGGQCRMLDFAFKPSKYNLIDIDAALKLSKRYLENYTLNSCLVFQTMNEVGCVDYDLCISNYAFSELPRSIQDMYLNKIILRSKRGYITYSDNFTPNSFNTYQSDDLLKIIPGSIKIEENPKTGPNFIILWGHNL